LHPVALDLLKLTGPLAVSSANRSGEPSATTAAEAEAQLGSTVAAYLDGGACPGDMASTIVDLTGTVPRLLRAGVVPIGRLREVIALAVADVPDEKIFSADERAAKVIQEAFGTEGQAPAAGEESSAAGEESPSADKDAPAPDEESPAADLEAPGMDVEASGMNAEAPGLPAAEAEAETEASGIDPELAGVDEEASG
jgi:hypothetical protein